MAPHFLRSFWRPFALLAITVATLATPIQPADAQPFIVPEPLPAEDVEIHPAVDAALRMLRAMSSGAADAWLASFRAVDRTTLEDWTAWRDWATGTHRGVRVLGFTLLDADDSVARVAISFRGNLSGDTRLIVRLEKSGEDWLVDLGATLPEIELYARSAAGRDEVARVFDRAAIEINGWRDANRGWGVFGVGVHGMEAIREMTPSAAAVLTADGFRYLDPATARLETDGYGRWLLTVLDRAGGRHSLDLHDERTNPAGPLFGGQATTFLLRASVALRLWLREHGPAGAARLRRYLAAPDRPVIDTGFLGQIGADRTLMPLLGEREWAGVEFRVYGATHWWIRVTLPSELRITIDQDGGMSISTPPMPEAVAETCAGMAVAVVADPR